MIGRVFTSDVRDLTPSLYAIIVNMNARDRGGMRWAIQAARGRWSRTRSEVAVLMVQGQPRAVAAWVRTSTRHEAIHVYTPIRWRRRGYGARVLLAMHARHPEAMMYNRSWRLLPPGAYVVSYRRGRPRGLVVT